MERIAHERFIDDRSAPSSRSFATLEESLPYDSDDACLIRVTRRDWEKARRVPADLAAELTKTASEGMEAWVVARADNDYAAFRPWLDRHLELKREYIACFDAPDDPYDVLLDDYEPGTTTAEVRAVFDRLKEELVPLIAGDGRCRRAASATGPFPEDGQRAIGVAVMTAFGFDDLSFRLDSTVHPFCSSLRDDRRPGDDAVRRARPRVAVQLHARDRPRPLRARRQPDARAHAARLGLLVGPAREPEPSLGERGRPLAAVLPLAAPAARRDVPGGTRQASRPSGFMRP